ncbi:MAG: amidohydrolase family protein [Candidatus Altiarchaeota archaeon]|nr:amidohydrolase family protein [Candidatus Altiarchaeota archaeon]
MRINTSVLSGDGFSHIEESHISIEDGLITEVGDGYEAGGLDYKRYLAIPSFCNAHTHIGDSFARDAATGLSVKQAVGKTGLKWRLYKKSSRKERLNAMRATIDSMLGSGTTMFSDFREFGIKGIDEIREALEGKHIRPVILGRDVDELLCDGLGLNLYQAGQISDKRKKILALHAGELDGEVSQALSCNPDIIVHFTLAAAEDIREAARRHISVVACPRTNALLGVGFPPVRELIDANVPVSLGTDNVLFTQPDMFQEMAYLYTASCLEKKPLSPSEILWMATSGGASAFGIHAGVIKKRMHADITLLDRQAPALKYSRNILASVVHRCSGENVRKVISGGRLVVDKDRR